MAANADTLVNADPTSTTKVVQTSEAITGAVVHEAPGPYDLVVDLEADTQEDITAIFRHKVRLIKGGTNTVTCICF